MRRTPRPIVDSEETVLAVLGGQPRSPEWEGVARDAAEAMEEAQQQCESLKGGHRSHRRGDFLAGAIGASYGGGRTVCEDHFLHDARL